MFRCFVLAVLVSTVAACSNDLSGAAANQGAPANQPRQLQPAGAGNGGGPDSGTDDDGADDGTDDDGADDGSGADDDGTDDGSGTDDDNGTGDADDGAAPPEPGPPPAAAAQSCVEWTDCGPWFVNENSGFDCVAGSCVCNAEDGYDEACAAINGVWSDADCFCYVGAAPMPSEDPDEWVADDEDDDYSYDDDYDDGYDDDDSGDPRADRVCWWRWRETCEPDRWVDTGGYEYECDGSGECGYVYEEDGYWESGDCSGYWLRRCDDGTEKRYG